MLWTRVGYFSLVRYERSLLLLYLDQLRTESTSQLPEDAIAGLKVKKGDRSIALKEIAQVGLNDSNEIIVLASVPEFTAKIHSAIVGSLPGVYPIKNSTTMLTIPHQSSVSILLFFTIGEINHMQNKDPKFPQVHTKNRSHWNWRNSRPSSTHSARLTLML